MRLNQATKSRAAGKAGYACVAVLTVASFVGIGQIVAPHVASAEESAASEPVVAGSAPQMRRLTEQQYRNSIKAIFGPKIDIRGTFEREQRQGGLGAIGASTASISPAGFEQYLSMAKDIAGQVVSDPVRDKTVGCGSAALKTFDEPCARQFLSSAALKLYRRPPTGAEMGDVMRIARDATKNLNSFDGGLRVALTSLIASPNFLFRIDHVEKDPKSPTGIRLDAYSKAQRLSFLLTDGPPDDHLMALAANGDLQRPEVLRAEADRLIASAGFETGVRAFFHDLLGFDKFASLSKDSNQFPTFNAQVADDAQEQTLRTIVDQLVTKDGDYGGLFTRTDTYLTRSLGWIYQTPVSTREGWERNTQSADFGRSGILTDFSVLALYSHAGRSSPTLRGKFIREAFLCQPVPPPPPGINFAIVEDVGNQSRRTARERLMAHQTVKTCAGCHKLTDPIGLTYEGFDAEGAVRTTENGAPIDTSGTLDGKTFGNPAELGAVLAESSRAKQCIVTQTYRYALGREPTSAEKPLLEYYQQMFARGGYRFKALMRTLADSEALYRVSPEGPATPAPAPVSRTASVHPQINEEGKTS